MKHLKLFFALFAMLALGVGNAWGADFTLNSNSSVTVDGVTVTFAKADGATAPTWYAAGLRLYAKNTITVTSENEITSIVFNWEKQGSKTFASVTSNVGSYSHPSSAGEGTWTGSSKSVVFTLGSTSGSQLQLNTLSVTTAGSATQKQKYTLTYQAGSVTGSFEVEEGANLLDALKDITPVACDPTSTEPIGWSESEITTKQADAPTLLTDADVMPSEEHSVYYVFAKKETIDGGVVNNNAFSATLGGSSGDNISSGYVLTKEADEKAGYYQDGSGDVRYVQIKSTSPMFTSTPNSITVTAKIGGGTGDKTLSNPVEAQLVDKDGNLIGSAVTITKKITTKTGDSYEVNVPTTGITSAYGLRISHKKESGYNVRYYSMSLSYTTSGTSTIFTDYITSCGSAPDEIVRTLKSIAITGMKQEFVEGDEFTFGGTCTATYSVTKNDVAQDDETKTVTPTVSAPNMTQIGEQTVNVSYTDGGVTAETSYTINITEKPKYTIIWNNAGDDSNTTTVVQGAALGELLPVADCTSGKKFMGWTAATEVNSDGSGIVYVKETDIPTSDMTYHAVFAVVEGGDGTPTTATVSIADYANAKSWKDATQYKEINIDANLTATANGGGNTGKYYENGENWRLYQNESPTLTISATANYEIQTVKVTYTNTNDGILTLDGSNVTSGTESEINAASVTFGVGNTGSATNGQVRITAIEVVYASAAKKSDYSLNCDIHQDPNLTLLETEINFGTVAQNETVTETLKVSGGYLAEDVALTISGTNASFFSVSPETITKAEEVNQDVTITYNPTATGDHTATLTIKSGEITKTVALSGTVLAPGKWVLVKNVTELSAGDEVIIASASSNYAIGIAASNNYKGAAITKVGETANTTADVTILTVEETGVAEAPYAFKTDGKYLYAASSSANQLKAQATNNTNGQWAVTITAEGVASIVAAKSSNRNVMQCNPNNGSPIFACYSSASYEALAIYRNSENVVKPVISGEADFVGSTQVTITAQSGLTVYYTTDGSTPDKTATQYSTPFTISETTTVKAIAYDATDNASPVAEMTFTKQELVNVANAMALAKDEIAYFDEFEVVKVVAGKGNIYIKDESGHGLIYDFTLAGQLKDGDRVQGFVGISSPYNGLPEAKPYNVTYEDLTITAGTAAEPYDFTSTAIAETDINKYIVFQNVEIATEVSISDSEKEFSLTIGGNSVKFYNQFGVNKTLEAGKIYDIYGFVAVYEKDGNRTLQAYFYEAVQDGEVIQKYTVTYNAGGATGTVPVDNAEYSEGAEVYLKSATGLTYEGYEYKGWKVTDKDGNEISVAENKFNMPASNVTVTAQWEEIVVTPRQDFSAGYWVLVSSASELTAGDKIMITAAEENFAMKSYESGNNCGQIEITKLGEGKFVKWISEVGVFELAANGSNYIIQDVNTKQYLYAAGTGTSNHLKASNNIATDENASKYLWTISFTDEVPTVKATSENRNTLMYNTGSNLFACYASGQKAIALYKYVTSVETTKVSPSVESGIFSVGAGKYVQFSTGNLQYEVGTNTWSFASQQYEVIGGDAYDPANPTNTNYGMNVPGYTGKLDLFAWSCDGKFGVNPSNADADYKGEFADWGKLVNETGWSTLTRAQMEYLLERKKDGKKLWGLATLEGKVALILLPDNWNTAIEFTYGYVPTKWNFTANELTEEDWNILEANGAVLLPAGGSRAGGSGNKIGFDGETVETDATKLDANGDYFHVDNVGDYGYYWLSSTAGELADYLILPASDNTGANTYSPDVWSREKRRGNSVRLVKAIEPTYTRDGQTSGAYGTVCYPENIVWCDGATLYEVAGKEGNKVIFDEVTTPKAGMPYIFLAHNAEVLFFCGDQTAAAGNHNSLYGTFTVLQNSELEGMYMVQNNKIVKCNPANSGVAAYRAYFKGSELDVLGKPGAQMPGRRRITMGTESENTATGTEDVIAPEGQTLKLIENGQLVIIRNGEKFNAQGIKF